MTKYEPLRVIDFEGIGRVWFMKKASVRTLKITVRPLRNIMVTVPHNVSFEAAGNFVKVKREWIMKSQARFARYRMKPAALDETTVFQTRDHMLQLGRHNKSTIKTLISNGIILVLFPEHADVNDIRIQTAIRKAVHAAWRIEAKRYLPELVRELAIMHHFTYNKLTFRDNKTRWGSCSRNNNINLNIHLMRLPAHLCEYIILHELCHSIQKNHKKAFWQLLDSVTGGKARLLDKEMNAYMPAVW